MRMQVFAITHEPCLGHVTLLEDHAAIERIERSAVRMRMVDALCSHGFRNNEECIDCEDGWSTDGIVHFEAPYNTKPLVAWPTDDLAGVCYVTSVQTNTSGRRALRDLGLTR